MPREHLAVRVPPAAQSWIDQLMTATGASRTEVFRAILSVAAMHSPEVNARIVRILAAEFRAPDAAP